MHALLLSKLNPKSTIKTCQNEQPGNLIEHNIKTKCLERERESTTNHSKGCSVKMVSSKHFSINFNYTKSGIYYHHDIVPLILVYMHLSSTIALKFEIFSWQQYFESINFESD